MIRSIRGRVCWPIWRIAGHPRIKDDYYTIARKWSLADLYEAYLVTDLWDAIEKERQEKDKPKGRKSPIIMA